MSLKFTIMHNHVTYKIGVPNTSEYITVCINFQFVLAGVIILELSVGDNCVLEKLSNGYLLWLRMQTLWTCGKLSIANIRFKCIVLSLIQVLLDKIWNERNDTFLKNKIKCWILFGCFLASVVIGCWQEVNLALWEKFLLKNIPFFVLRISCLCHNFG